MARFARSRFGKMARLVAVSALFALSLRLHPEQPTERIITGTVEDRQHEPLKGAVVQIESESTSSVVSYITDAAGHYSFKRLSSDDDYKLWATYRTRRSQTREISHFDGKADRVVDLTIVLE